MKIHIENYCSQSGKRIKLRRCPTKVERLYKSNKKYKKHLSNGKDKLREQQQLLYASNTHSLLIIFQAMDAAGKDSSIKHVMSGINPQGCQVFSFKHPNSQELDHDFLWRTTVALPERGRIGIFNRSYYEEVLIARVHPEILKAENIPFDSYDSKSLWKGRYKSINHLEEHLKRNGTKVIKFFLHLSKDEQRKRFIERIDEPKKNWKFSRGDIEERKYWDTYMDAYEACINETSSEGSPWYIIPADDKKNARLIILRVILEALQSFKMSYPKTNERRRQELIFLRKKLIDE